MTAFFESLFEFFFKYRPVVFERGHFAFGAGRSSFLLLLIGAAVAVPALLTYTRVRASSTRVDRAILGAMRMAAVAVILFCLFRPMLVLSEAVPQRNVLGILLDDSRSMRIADVDGRSRADFVRRNFAGPDSALYAALSERFILRFFRFSAAADRVTDPAALAYVGGQSHLGAALDYARQDLSSVPLAGLVLVTDGADNATTALAEPLLSLKARSVPVFTVGVGREAFEKDIEISRVEAPRSVLKGSSVAVDVTVAQKGLGGATVPLIVEDGGRIISTQQVELPAGGETAPVRVHVPATESGARTFRFRIPVQPGEAVSQNNEQDVLVTVADRKEKILYIEGEPRPEFKFLRKAVADDPNLRVVALQRTADKKYLRLGVDDSLELVSGFPTTREELFAYRAIILGSVEASLFTGDQLRMLADFVGERGGGLLLLGGRRSFGEGGYAGTPLAEVIPLELDDVRADSTTPYFAELSVELTPAGMTHAATHLAGTDRESAARWRALSAVSAVNRVRRVKPGATALLTGAGKGTAQRQPVLAYQRYGRGLAIAFAIQDSWRWQMDAAVAVEDMTHETIWRQLLRWVVSDVPGRVAATTSADRVGPNEPVTIRATISDDTYLKVNNAQVIAHVAGPSGKVSDVPMEWTVNEDGEYRGSFTPDSAGVFEVTVDATAGGKTLPSDVVYVRAAERTNEFFGAEMRSSLLKRIAGETGGRFYTAGTVGSLPKDIVYTESGATVREQKDLWDMPVIFLVLVGLMAGEWAYRRARGLA